MLIITSGLGPNSGKKKLLDTGRKNWKSAVIRTNRWGGRGEGGAGGWGEKCCYWFFFVLPSVKPVCVPEVMSERATSSLVSCCPAARWNRSRRGLHSPSDPCPPEIVTRRSDLIECFKCSRPQRIHPRDSDPVLCWNPPRIPALDVLDCR